MSGIERRVSYRNPFLRRDWRKATGQTPRTGTSQSSTSFRLGNKYHDLMGDKYHDGGEDGHRAAIRHQIYRDPAGFPLPSYKQLPNQQQPWATKSFHAKLGRDEVNKFLQQQALQLDVAKIIHKESRRVKLNGVFHGTSSVPLEEISSCRVRCVVIITTQEQGEQVPVFLDSQVCDMKTFRSALSSWPEARFVMNSFYVPREKLCVQREDDQGFALADSYSIQVEFRPAGDQWPPLELVRGEHEDLVNGALPSNSKKWVLSATIPNIYHHNQNRKPAPIMLRKEQQVECATDFTVDIDARWCSCLFTSSVDKQDKVDSRPSITVNGVNERLQLSPPQVNGHTHVYDEEMVNGHDQIVNGDDQMVDGENHEMINGHDHDHDREMDDVFGADQMPSGVLNEVPEGPDSPSNGSGTTLVNIHLPTGMPASPPEEDGELTPSRARRTRTEVNYNVRQMWNTAVGKEYKNRRKNAAGGALSVEPIQGITYILPKEQVEVDGFCCFLCGEENNSVAQLRAHLSTHPYYIFEEDGSRGGHLYIDVSHDMDNPGAALGPQAFNLGFSAKPLDLEKIVEGDMSWVTSRLDPENGADLEFFQVPLTDKRRAAASRPGTAPRRASQKKALPKKVVIPTIKQPLYDPVSKAQLVPGSEYRAPIVDDSWITQKHRDTLMDFVDVEPDEKEYMREWDSFILQKHLTSAKYLPKAYLAFVRSKAPWIVAKPQRGVEFAKHAAMLLARSAIDNVTLHEATLICTDARKDVQANKIPSEAPRSPPRGPDRCTLCHEIVSRPAMLVCASKTCQHRLYHKVCGKQPRGQAPRAWLCPECLTPPAA